MIHKTGYFSGKPCAVALVGFLMFVGSVPAQYRIFSWDSFETGQFPPTLMYLHEASPQTVTLFDYALPGIPPVFSQERSRRECGRFGLKMLTPSITGRDSVVSVLSHLRMDRGLLGDSGRALFQADFYLPEGEGYFPNSAVLAHAVSDPAQKWFEMYRFGIRLNKFLYFSFSDKSAGGKIIKQDSIESFNLQRPGWHRLQIIFEGQSRIICAVNGKATSFSPIEEPSLTLLQPGIMIASPPEREAFCIIDNLSIQWTPEDVPIPDSPWLEANTPIPASDSALPWVHQPAATTLDPAPDVRQTPTPAASAGQSTPAPKPPELVWLTSTDEAWAFSQTHQRPILVVFYAPRAKYWGIFQELLKTQPAVAELLSRFVLLKVDLNTLHGGAIAHRFQVFRVPCFQVLGNDGQTRMQMVMSSDTPWEAIAASLQTIMPRQ
jgi:hypothetical protein